MPILSYLCSWVKPRQSRSDEPSTSFSFGKKKRTKSGLGKTDDQDHQRSNMIRKSLQSRTSSRTTTRPEDNNYDTEEEDSGTSTSLRTDWKAYEADIQRNKSTLMRSHPGVDRARIQTRLATLESPASSSHALLPAQATRAALSDDLAVVSLAHVAGVSLADTGCDKESGGVEKDKLKDGVVVRELVMQNSGQDLCVLRRLLARGDCVEGMGAQAKVARVHSEVFNLELSRAGLVDLPAQGVASTADFVEILLTTNDEGFLETSHAQRLSKGRTKISSANTNDTSLENILDRVSQGAKIVEDRSPRELLADRCNVAHAGVEHRGEQEGVVGLRSTSVSTLFTSSSLNDFSELLYGNGCSCFPHDTGTLGEDICSEIKLCEMQGHKKRGRLGLSDLVCEEVRDGLGNLLRRDGGFGRPELGEKRFDIDRWKSILPTVLGLRCHLA
ncbi:hypothetical protein HG531_002180 [Fusarium graminearum]|nr:hypothetical protein HG531_002180 [Fusarium graminearum]